jgi:uncharacterized protein
MFKNKQSDIMMKLSPKEILINLYLTQLIFLVVAIIICNFFYRDLFYFFYFISYKPLEIVLYGGACSLIIISLDILLWWILPKEMVDDGGINEKIFASLSILQIFFITLVISFCEEVLFRGTLQPKIGLILTSIIFAVMHVRYLHKPVLLSSALLVSFLLGWLFEVTGNLSITIFAHFMIDFILAILIRIKPFAFLR